MLLDVERRRRDQGYLEVVEPLLYHGAALGLTAEHCCRIRGTLGDSKEWPPRDKPRSIGNKSAWIASYENVTAVSEIVNTWSTSYYLAAYFKGFVEESIK